MMVLLPRGHQYANELNPAFHVGFFFVETSPKDVSK